MDLLRASRDVGLVWMLLLLSSLDDTKRAHIELKANSESGAHRRAGGAEPRRCPDDGASPASPSSYSDDPAEIRALVRAVRNAGTTRIYAGVMRLYSTCLGRA